MTPQEHLTDNGSAFTSGGFTQHLAKFSQVIRFAGAGAHHANGVAERAMQTVMSVARAMMLHAATHWPDVADATLWPMAVAHAVFLFNHVPQTTTGLSPHDVFSRTHWPQHKFHDLHVWGCPVCVLEKALVDGKKLPRWSARSQRMANMGFSPKHPTATPLVLNPETGSLVPPFSVVFDDWFATVATSVDDLPDFNSPEWSSVHGASQFEYPFEDIDDEDAEFGQQPSAADQPSDRQASSRRARVARHMENESPLRPLPVQVPPTETPAASIAVDADASPVLSPSLSDFNQSPQQRETDQAQAPRSSAQREQMPPSAPVTPGPSPRSSASAPGKLASPASPMRADEPALRRSTRTR